MQESLRNAFIAKYKWSKDLIEMKKQEKIYFSIKDYDNAERTRLKIQIQEQIENEVMQEKLAIHLEREE